MNKCIPNLYLYVEIYICIFQKWSPYANTNKFVEVSNIHTDTSLICTDQSKIHTVSFHLCL